MRRYVFYISNARHHWEVVSRVSSEIAARGGCSVIVSLCEHRGERTPESINSTVPIVQVLDKSPQLKRNVALKTRATGRVRPILQWWHWHLTLRPKLANKVELLADDVAIIPNDLAYPFDKIVSDLNKRSQTWVLYQEGILFPLPASSLRPYGAGGASAIAAWGRYSKRYFVETAKAGEETVLLTGSPRHDEFKASVTESEVAEIRRRVPAHHKLIMFFGTTVDKPGGHCSTEEKMMSIEGLLRSLECASTSCEFTFWCKPHAGENIDLYNELLCRSSIASNIILDRNINTRAAVAASDAIIINGSSVGLEALLFKARVGVIPVPNTGFPFDYGESEVYVKIREGDGANDILQLLSSSPDEEDIEKYLECHFSNIESATSEFADMLERV